MQNSSHSRMYDIIVRPMEEADLVGADRIMRIAFGTFIGLPDPMKFMGDADYVKTRFRADPSAALIAEIDDRIVGSNFALDWGSVGIFGPLTIEPEFWNKGVAIRLLEETMKIFERWGTKHMGLFTFAQSTKHVHLYQKFGFWPRYLTVVMSKQIDKKSEQSHDAVSTYYSTLTTDEKNAAIEDCAKLTDEIFGGLDLRKEISSVDRQGLGETILLRDPQDHKKLRGIAICHSGPNTEAGSGNCYVKFAAAMAPTNSSAVHFDKLLDACEQYAYSRNASRIVGGINTGRHKAYTRMLERGFRADMHGVAMHKPNDPAYNLPDVYLIDDWR
ncbi:MAG TPA: GNAT family N-acetyltransferase [Nitrososphaera sp.]